MTLAIFVFAAPLATASLNFSDANLDLSVNWSESGLDLPSFTMDSMEQPGELELAAALPDLVQPDVEDPNATIVKYAFAEDPDSPDSAPYAWIELFHPRS